MKWLIYLLGLCILISSVSAYYYCYQESANITNQTGIDGDGSNNCTLNYTGSYYGNNNSDGQLFINYSKAVNALNSSLWIARMNTSNYSNTLPATCWDAYTNKLSLKIVSTAAFPSSVISYCYNSTDWLQINKINSSCTSLSGGGFVSDIVPPEAVDGNWSTGITQVNPGTNWGHLNCDGGAQYAAFFYDDAMRWALFQSLNISAGNIQDFYANVTDLNTSVLNSYHITTGVLSLDYDFSEHHTYNITFYVYDYPIKSITYTMNSSTYQFINQSLSKKWLNISIYNASNNALITSSVSVTANDLTNSSTYTRSTSTGSTAFSDLHLTDLYQFHFSATYFSPSNYYVNFNGSLQNDSLSMYLVPSSNEYNVSLCFYDPNGAPLSNLYVSESVQTNNLTILQDTLYSDINGRVIFPASSNYPYIFDCVSSKYSCAPITLNPPINSFTLADGCNYDITLPFLSGIPGVANKNVSGYYSFNNISSILTFYYTSGDSSILNYSYTVSKNNLTICYDSSNLLSNSFTCDLTGYTGVVYIQGVIDNEKIFFGDYLTLRNLPTLFDNMTPQEAAFWSGLILLVLILGGVVVAGHWGALIGNFVGSLMIYWLHLFTIVTVGMIAVSVVMTLVIGFGLKRY